MRNFCVRLSAVFFWYHYVEIIRQQSNELKRDGCHTVASVSLNLVGGIGNAASYWVPCFPLDSIKTRLQTRNPDSPPSTFMKEGRWLYNDGGVRAFYRGLGATMLRGSLSSGIMFMMYCSSLEWCIADA